jgi:hypothetical protein
MIFDFEGAKKPSPWAICSERSAGDSAFAAWLSGSYKKNVKPMICAPILESPHQPESFRRVVPEERGQRVRLSFHADTKNTA